MKIQAAAKIGAMAALVCATAFADGGDKNQNAAFTSGLLGSLPNQTVAGIPSAGAPWTVREGHAVVQQGRLKVEVKGLLIAAGTLANGNAVPPNLIGTTGAVTMVAASLVCNGMIAGSTAVAPLSTAGDAEMEGRLSIGMCASPSVLVRIAPSMSSTASELGPFIALSGSRLGDDNGDVNDDHGADGAGHDINDDHGRH
jgi:hypothetical protein